MLTLPTAPVLMMPTSPAARCVMATAKRRARTMGIADTFALGRQSRYRTTTDVLHGLLTCALVGIIAATAPPVACQAPVHDADRWESTIRKFEQLDRERPPAPGGNLFLGSSSIVRWNIEDSFSGLPVANRGFGGSQLPHVLHFMDRLVPRHRPAVVVLYCGDNDLAHGRTAEQVAEDYRTFVTRIREELPDTRIVWIAIKPSGRRWDNRQAITRANALVKAAQGDNEVYVDVWAPMLGADGQPRPELFVADELHLSPAGYELWTKLVRPHLVTSPP